MIVTQRELSTSQLAALFLEALRRAADDPEAAIAARHLGDALDRRRPLQTAGGAPARPDNSAMHSSLLPFRRPVVAATTPVPPSRND